MNAVRRCKINVWTNNPSSGVAVFGNVGSLVSFRIGHAGAEELSKEFGKTYPLETFTGLDRYEVIARLAENGRTREPFRARTLPPIEHRVGRRKKLIARSREKYAAPRAEVEKKINRWLAGREVQRPRVRKGRIPFLPVKL